MTVERTAGPGPRKEIGGPENSQVHPPHVTENDRGAQVQGSSQSPNPVPAARTWLNPPAAPTTSTTRACTKSARPRTRTTTRPTTCPDGFGACRPTERRPFAERGQAGMLRSGLFHARGVWHPSDRLSWTSPEDRFRHPCVRIVNLSVQPLRDPPHAALPINPNTCREHSRYTLCQRKQTP
jgi:hypothetical protein